MFRTGASIVALVIAAASAAAQTQYPAAGERDPQILARCEGATSLTQRTICNNRDLAALERDIHRYVEALQRRGTGSAAALEASQIAFERQREAACGNLAAATDYDGPAHRCLVGQQRARLVQLAAQSGSALSGVYRAARPDLSGDMAIVEWPDGRAQVMIDTLTPPDARTCSINFTTTAGTALSGTPAGAPSCRVSIDALGRTATVRSEGDCSAVCVINGRPDGVYRR